jgi:hypothetical protein
MLAAREDLVDQANEIAGNRGLTLFAVTNEALEQVVRLDKMGIQLSNVVKEYEAFKAAKEAGFIFVPESLLYEMVEKIHCESRDWMTKKWVESGEWCGKYYSVKNAGNKLESLGRDVPSFFWNVREFDVVQNGKNEVFVRCMSPRFPESYGVFLSVFLEGALNVMGYKCTEKHVTKGFIQLKFQALKQEPKENG